MDRRNFLQYVTALGAGTSLPAVASPSSQEVPRLTKKNCIESPQFELPTLLAEPVTRIGVIAVGGAAATILSDQDKLPFIHRTIAIDSNPFSLNRAKADQSICVEKHLGKKVINPNRARFLALGMKNEIAEAIADLDFAFIISGMGGATGTGVAPVVAEVVHDHRITSIGIPLLPFAFEDKRRQQIAEAGARALGRRTTATLSIPNEIFAQIADEQTLLSSVVAQPSRVFSQVYQAVAGAIAQSGLIGADFEDFRQILASGRTAGFGSHTSAISFESAANEAIQQPLLGINRLSSARGLFVAIEGTQKSLRMREIRHVMNLVNQLAPEASVVFSATCNLSMSLPYRVSILSSGHHGA